MTGYISFLQFYPRLKKTLSVAGIEPRWAMKATLYPFYYYLSANLSIEKTYGDLNPWAVTDHDDRRQSFTT